MNNTQKQKEAQDVLTAPARLAVLAKDNDPKVRILVAANPNTPIADLCALWEKFPEQFWQNPLVPLLLLENPNFAWKMPSKTLTVLLSKARCPGWFYESIASHPNENIRYFAAEQPCMPTHLLEAFAVQEVYIRRRVAKNPDITVDICEKLCRDVDLDVRCNIAKNPATPLSILEELIKDEKVRDSVAKNPNIPISLLEHLATYEKNSVAENPKTPGYLLARLAESNDQSVRYSVALHPNTPRESLEQLARRNEDFAHGALIRNKNTPGSALLEVSKQVKHYSILDLLKHPNTPIEAFYQVYKDAMHQWRFTQIVKLFAKHLRSNPRAPQEILKEVAVSKEIPLRSAAARNPNTPLSSLEKLATEPQAEIRAGVAQNPSASPALLEILARDSLALIRLRVSQNPSTPSAVLTLLIKDIYGPVRYHASQHPKVTDIQSLLQDPEPWIRKRTALDRIVPLEE